MYNNQGMMRPQLQLQNNVAPGRNNSNYTGNPMGVYNSSPNFQSSGQQQQNLGRYTPPTYNRGPNNQQVWNDQGGYEYNVPNSYGGPGNYYGQEGQGYGRQGMQQGYGGGGGGYRTRPQFQQTQQNYFGQPDQYQSFGQEQQRPQMNPYSSGQLPSIMASYMDPNTETRQNNKLPPQLQGSANDLPVDDMVNRRMRPQFGDGPYGGGGGGNGYGSLGPGSWGGRIRPY